MKECKNCGMPMVKNEDFGNGDPKSALCKHCFSDKSIILEDSDKKSDDENGINGIEDLGKIDKIDLF